MAPGTGDAGRVPPTSLGARGWWQWHGSMQWRRTRYLSNGDFGDIVHCFSFNTIQNDMEYPLKQRESLTGSSLYGLIKFSMHMYIHIYYNYITLNLPKRQAVKDSSRRRSHCIFLGMLIAFMVFCRSERLKCHGSSLFQGRANELTTIC